MLCPKCHSKVATVKYAEVVNGEVSEKLLCPDCATKFMEEDAQGFSLQQPTTSQKNAPVSEVVDEAVRLGRRCTFCNTLLSQIMEDERVGCARCYEEFSDQIAPHLYDLHFTLQHKGKVPNLNEEREHLKHALQKKRALLRKILKAEKYEEAAQLRDEIKQLEQGLYPVPSGAK